MKRRRLAALLCALALLCPLTACGDGAAGPGPDAADPPASSPSASQPTGQEAGLTLPYYPEAGFHPITGLNRTNLSLAGLMYEGLFELDGTFTPHGVLCKGYSLSEDGLTWTFTLRPARFSDGSPLTAEDVVYSLALSREGGSFYAGRLDGVAAIRAEEGAVVIGLTAPNAALPALLDIPVVKEDGDVPLGSGPYVLTRRGEELSLTRSEGWWQGGEAAVDTISLYPVQGADSLIHAFDTREISLVSTDLTGPNALGYSGSYEVWDYPTTVMVYVGYNAAAGPCAAEAVRRALSYGYDRAYLERTLYAQHVQASALPVSPASPLYDDELAEDYGYDPQELASILEGAGWERTGVGYVKGREELALTFLVSTDDPFKLAVAEHLTEALEGFGVAVELKALPWEDYLAALEGGEYDLYLGQVRLRASFDLSALIAPGGSLNYGHFQDREGQELLSAFLAAGESERAEAARRLYHRLAATAPFTPLCFKNGSVLSHWGKRSDLTPTQSDIFYGLTH